MSKQESKSETVTEGEGGGKVKKRGDVKKNVRNSFFCGKK